MPGLDATRMGLGEVGVLASLELLDLRGVDAVCAHGSRSTRSPWAGGAMDHRPTARSVPSSAPAITASAVIRAGVSAVDPSSRTVTGRHGPVVLDGSQARSTMLAVPLVEVTRAVSPSTTAPSNGVAATSYEAVGSQRASSHVEENTHSRPSVPATSTRPPARIGALRAPVASPPSVAKCARQVGSQRPVH